MSRKLAVGLMLCLLALGACAKSMKQLEAMDDRALFEELHRAKFAVVGGGGYYHDVRKVLLEKHPEWPSHIRDAIEREQIVVGMTKLQAAASWGTPTTFRQATYRSQSVEMWVYGVVPGEGPLPTLASGPDRNRFLYFDGDELVGFVN